MRRRLRPKNIEFGKPSLLPNEDDNTHDSLNPEAHGIRSWAVTGAHSKTGPHSKTCACGYGGSGSCSGQVNSRPSAGSPCLLPCGHSCMPLYVHSRVCLRSGVFPLFSFLLHRPASFRYLPGDFLPEFPKLSLLVSAPGWHPRGRC